MYDPYSVLGLPRTAGEDEVKHAFRTLAKRFHPDTPEGASDKGRRFKDLSIAYEILGDAKKRRAYDRGEIDAHGNPRPGYVQRPDPEPENDSGRASEQVGEPGEQGHPSAEVTQVLDPDLEDRPPLVACALELGGVLSALATVRVMTTLILRGHPRSSPHEVELAEEAGAVIGKDLHVDLRSWQARLMEDHPGPGLHR